jgi:hypothetical protein
MLNVEKSTELRPPKPRVVGSIPASRAIPFHPFFHTDFSPSFAFPAGTTSLFALSNFPHGIGALSRRDLIRKGATCIRSKISERYGDWMVRA